MFDFYPEKTQREVFQSRALYPQALAMLIVSGISLSNLTSQHLPRWSGILLYVVAFALIAWSFYLRRLGKRVSVEHSTHR